MSSLGESGLAAVRLIADADPVLWSIVWRSLALSAAASALAFVLGTVLGAWLAVSRFTGRGLVLAVLNTLLSLPSVVVGLGVYLLLSRSGPLGFLGWLYSFKAMLLAQTVLVLPIVIALVRQVVEDADAAHGEQLRSLGASPRLRGLLLAWDERSALLTVALAAFGRAIAEVGAVMLVGGNMDGFTRVMTTAIALETSKGDLPLAMGLGLVLLGVVLLLQLLLGGLRAWLQKVDAAVPVAAAPSSGSRT
ncbi:tungstate uptake system permease protein TupB [Comamonadaceae bacterium OS-4]|nr:tungstate uptake system permease protein TupB [Comamonadaceae bacterium OS-4]